MAMDLYHMDISGPARAVRLIAAAVGQPLNLKTLDLFKKEQLQDWFLKINPQHTIPTLVDGDFNLAESRAIMCYIVNKCKPGSSLYPSCPKKRAIVDRYLYFDIGTLQRAIGDYFYPKLLQNAPLDPEKETKVKDALGFLQAFLGDNKYLLGDEPTVADFAIGTTLSMLEGMNYSLSDFPKVEAFYKAMQTQPNWNEINGKGVELVRNWAKSK